MKRIQCKFVNNPMKFVEFEFMIYSSILIYAQKDLHGKIVYGKVVSQNSSHPLFFKFKRFHMETVLYFHDKNFT